MRKIIVLFVAIICIFTTAFMTVEPVAAADKKEFPFITIEEYSVSKDKIIPGSDFKLTLLLKNNSETTAAQNVVIGVGCPTGVSPKYGTLGQAYFKSISKGETVEAYFEFSTLEEIYTYYLDFHITVFSDESNNDLILRIPVGTDSPFNITNVAIDENGIEGGALSASVAFKVIGLDYVKNVFLVASLDGMEVNTVSIGALSPGTSKTQLISVPLSAYGEHEVSISLLYEDITGKTGKMYIDSKTVYADRKIVQPTQTPDETPTGFMDRLKGNSKMLVGVLGVIGVLIVSALLLLISKRGKR